MPQKLIDQTTIQPDGSPGDDAFTAFAICNENFEDAEARLVVLEAGGGETGDRLDTEIAARTAADAALGARIDAEHSLLTQESADRIAAIQAEAGARAALDARLVGNNVLINGDFDFWQRGTQFANSNTYTADRWFMQQGFVTGQLYWQHTPLPGENNFPDSPYTLAINITGNTDNAQCHQVVEQRVEDVRTFAGKVCTLSFRVFNGGAAGRKIAVEFAQTFGSGGSAPVLGISPETFTLAAGMNYIKKTVAMPSVAGKTANYGHAAVVALWSSAGSNFVGRTGGLTPQTGSLYFSQIKWEPGAVATPFERRPIALELALAQRYYEKSYNLGVAPSASDNTGRCALGNSSNTNGQQFTGQRFKVVKRINPSVTVYPNNSNDGSPTPPGFVNQDDNTRTAVTVVNIGTAGFEIIYNNGPGRWGGWYHFVADAEI